MQVRRRHAAIGHVLLGLVLVGTAACASSSTAVTPPPQVLGPSLDTKVGWLLRLEQQRVMRDPEVVQPAGPEAMPASAAEPAFRPAVIPDLAALVADPDSIVRARAATAIGRVNVDEGVGLLEAALGDPAEEVRASAAFGIGLMARRASLDALHAALDDPSLLVRSRVIEALGLIGDPTTAPVIAAAAAGCPAVLAPIAPDDEQWPKAPEVEVCRLALYALVRLGDFAALAQVALDPQGRAVSRWWPVAYALQRIGDPRAIPALRGLAVTSGNYTVGFALRGLAAHGDADQRGRARALATDGAVDVKIRVAAVRLLARVGTAEDARALMTILTMEPSSSPLAIEVVTALSAMGVPESFDFLVDGFTDPAPAMRAASLAAAAKVDPDTFLLVLSGTARDRDWSVRAALATVLGTLPADRVVPALVDLSQDEDPRVRPSALEALAELNVPDLADRLRRALIAEDFAERAKAAELVGVHQIEDGVGLLAAAYDRGESDSTYVARHAAIEAIAKYGAVAAETLKRALADREWPVRLRAAQLLADVGVDDAEPLRPAPLRHPVDYFSSDALLHPSYSPRAFIETRRGVIEVQLELVDAPLTVATFVEQVRTGLFNGMLVHRVVPGFVVQAGDPRGDGSGGAGYTQRDELSSTPYLRGTVGMALAGPETAGSQWFITTSPQPHLDGRYTAFGRVVGGWDVLDQIAPNDVIDRVRIWDGVELR